MKTKCDTCGHTLQATESTFTPDHSHGTPAMTGSLEVRGVCANPDCPEGSRQVEVDQHDI